METMQHSRTLRPVALRIVSDLTPAHLNGGLHLLKERLADWHRLWSLCERLDVVVHEKIG